MRAASSSASMPFSARSWRSSVVMSRCGCSGQRTSQPVSRSAPGLRSRFSTVWRAEEHRVDVAAELRCQPLALLALLIVVREAHAELAQATQYQVAFVVREFHA